MAHKDPFSHYYLPPLRWTNEGRAANESIHRFIEHQGMEDTKDHSLQVQEEGGRGISASSRGRNAEWELRDHLEKQGWVVIRSAASRIVDLIALKEGRELFIEVKSTSEPSFKMSRSKHNAEQLRDLLEYSRLIDAKPYYAIRFRTGWVIDHASWMETHPIIKEGEGRPLESWIP